MSGYRMSHGDWRGKQAAAHAAVFAAQMEMLDEDLRPPLPTAEEDADAAEHPYTLNLDMDERMQLQSLRDLRRLQSMQTAPNGNDEGQTGNADGKPGADSVGVSEPPIQFILSEKSLAALLNALGADPIAEFIKRHVTQAVADNRVVSIWLHARIAAAGGETVNTGGKS